jgi:hypothetical protein
MVWTGNMETERYEKRCRKGRFLLCNEEGKYIRVFKILGGR